MSAPASSRNLESTPPARPGASARVLVVASADDPRCDLVAAALHESGVELVVANGGDEALEIARGGTAGCVVLCPDGRDVDAALAARLGTAAPTLLPVLHLGGDDASDDASDDARVRALDAGADAYLARGCSPAELRATVGAQLRLVRVSARREYVAARAEAQAREFAAAERAARQTEEALIRSLGELSHEFVSILELDGRFRYVNASVERTLGYEPASLLGTLPTDLVHPDDLGTMLATHRRVIEGGPGAMAEMTVRLRHRDGSWRYFEGYGQNLLHEPAVRGITSNARDVTARVEAEASLHFQAYLLDSVEQAVIATDAANRVIFWNRFAETLYGWSAAEAIGRVVSELLMPDVDAADRDAQIARARARAERGRRTDWTLRRKDGSEIRVSASSSVILDAAGRHAGIVGVSTDVTAERDAEAALERAQRLQASILSSVGDGILGVDARGVTTFVNRAACEMLGYPAEEIVGQHQHELVHGRRRDGTPYPADQCLIYKALHEQVGYRSTDEVLWRKDGTSLDVDLACTPLIEDGEARGAVLTFRDVSKTRALEAQLRQAQKMEAVGQLAGGVAHDFNNLLTVIGAHGGFLLDALQPGDPLRDDARAIHDAAQRAAALTRQLLAFSRKQVVRPVVVDLNRLVAETRKMLGRLLGDEIEIVTCLAEGLGRVLADPGQLDQVIMNFAVNARDAMPDGGRLTLRTRDVVVDAQSTEPLRTIPSGRYVLLEVSDTGTGMDEATRAHLFEPFFTTKALGKGTGLGLATVYGIVKQAGGHILVESAPGRGASFQVYLPCVAEEQEPAAAPAAGSAPRGVETILLVEDDAAVRGLARRVLRRHGYQVVEACDGAEALAIFGSHADPIHLVLSDASMPGMSGGELVARLRQQRPELRVVFMSGYTDDEVVRRGILASIPFVPKPFTHAELASAVRAALDA